jgi:hypothetical protein
LAFGELLLFGFEVADAPTPVEAPVAFDWLPI